VAGRVIEGLAVLLREALSSRSLTVAVAESCTGGDLCAAVTAVPGSSAYFLGGVVAYADAVKVRELFVPDALLASRGAVSEEVALAMAEGVRRRFGAGIGVGTTGIAGPEGGSPEKPVGTVFVGIVAGTVRISSRLSLRGDRKAVRRETVAFTLKALIAAAEGVSESFPPSPPGGTAP
jgi:PncC family amidohydrolase